MHDANRAGNEFLEIIHAFLLPKEAFYAFLDIKVLP
jgi:hypothetical protein